MLHDVHDGGLGISKTRDTKGKGGDGRGTEELPEGLQHPKIPQQSLCHYALEYFRFEVLNKKLKILNDQGILCPMQGCHVKTDPYAINRLRRVSSECGTIVIPEGTYTPGLGFTEKTVSPLTLKEREKLEDLYEEALIDPARRLYCVKCAHVHDVEPVPEDRVPFQVNCTVKQETETLP